jgi:hypothetical protein
MVLSFVPMSTLDLMAALKALVSSPSNLLMMLATPFNSSMAMTGKAALWKSARIASPALAPDSVVEAALEFGVDLVEVWAAEVALEVVVDLVVALAVAGEALVVVTEEALLVLMLELLLQLPTLSLTTLLPALREVRRYMFAT